MVALDAGWKVPHVRIDDPPYYDGWSSLPLSVSVGLSITRIDEDHYISTPSDSTGRLRLFSFEDSDWAIDELNPPISYPDARNSTFITATPDNRIAVATTNNGGGGIVVRDDFNRGGSSLGQIPQYYPGFTAPTWNERSGVWHVDFTAFPVGGGGLATMDCRHADGRLFLNISGLNFGGGDLDAGSVFRFSDLNNYWYISKHGIYRKQGGVDHLEYAWPVVPGFSYWVTVDLSGDAIHVELTNTTSGNAVYKADLISSFNNDAVHFGMWGSAPGVNLHQFYYSPPLVIFLRLYELDIPTKTLTQLSAYDLSMFPGGTDPTEENQWFSDTHESSFSGDPGVFSLVALGDGRLVVTLGMGRYDAPGLLWRRYLHYYMFSAESDDLALQTRIVTEVTDPYGHGGWYSTNVLRMEAAGFDDHSIIEIEEASPAPAMRLVSFGPTTRTVRYVATPVGFTGVNSNQVWLSPEGWYIAYVYDIDDPDQIEHYTYGKLSPHEFTASTPKAFNSSIFVDSLDEPTFTTFFTFAHTPLWEGSVLYVTDLHINFSDISEFTPEWRIKQFDCSTGQTKTYRDPWYVAAWSLVAYNIAMAMKKTGAQQLVALVQTFPTGGPIAPVWSAQIPLRDRGHQRSFPRDDGRGMSTKRSWPPPTSKQNSPRAGPVGTYW